MFLAQDGRAALRTIRIGPCNGRVAEVLAGLEAGDRVVLHPSGRVADGVRLAQRTEATR